MIASITLDISQKKIIKYPFIKNCEQYRDLI